MSLPNHCQRYPRVENGRALGTLAFINLNPPQQTINPAGGCFIVYSDKFLELLGPEPEIEVILVNSQVPFAHEAGVFIPSTDEIFITSNQYYVAGKKHIQISKIKKVGNAFICEEIFPDGVAMANGAVNYKDGVLFCAQGTVTEPGAGGLVYMEPHAPYKTTMILNNYLGRPFNSVNDVVIHSDGSIWFTDPVYGFEQGIRSRPELPSLVYRYDPESGDIRAMADYFGKPNGICFSPDEKTVYVTDTHAVRGDGDFDSTRASTIYAFTVDTIHGEPFLTNRRLFALADNGIPDGIKCDMQGNVYSGCGDGVHVWTPGGSLIGKIYTPGGAANFCFGRDGELFLLNENKVWRAKLGNGTKGDLLKV